MALSKAKAQQPPLIQSSLIRYQIKHIWICIFIGIGIKLYTCRQTNQQQTGHILTRCQTILQLHYRETTL